MKFIQKHSMSKKTYPTQRVSLKKCEGKTSGKLILHFRLLDPISAEKQKKIFSCCKNIFLKKLEGIVLV